MLLFPGIAYGFPFVEFILKEEMVFLTEKCEKNATVLCEAALEQYNTIFTSGMVATTVGIFLFGIIQKLVGIFTTRLMCGLLTTAGLGCFAFYASNAYLLYPAMILVSLPSLAYISTNASIAPLFPSISTMFLVGLSGLYDASGGLFLVFKLLSEKFALGDMFAVATMLTIIIHIRTVFFMPCGHVSSMGSNTSLFNASIIGSMVQMRKGKINDEDKEDDSDENENTKSLKSIFSTLPFWCFLIYYNVMAVRVRTVPVWIVIWLDWTYADVALSEDLQSQYLDLYGYLLYMSPLFATLPATTFKVCSYLTGSKQKGDFYGIFIAMGFNIALGLVYSGQMCYQAESIEDTTNTIALIALYSIVKSIHYAIPGVVVYLYFPVEYFSVLYGVIHLPALALTWLNEPFFKLIINGSDISDANFVPVSIALSIVTFLCIIPLYFLVRSGLKIMHKEILKSELDFSENKSQL